jgi:thiosulfate/3-mercaptopyruvate sulfurtransferase
MSAAAASPERIIDAATARQLLDADRARFIDVRPPESYSEGHIPTAANIHAFFTYLATSDASGVRELTETFAEELREAGVSGAEGEHVVTYENSLRTLYGASCRAFYLLKLLGHPRVSVLGGGYEGWARDGHPTTRDAENTEKGAFQPKWNSEMWKGKADVLEALKDPNTVLLDVRDMEEWKGESSSPYGVDFAPRKGRLPGATHILWTDFMETDSEKVNFKSPEEIRAICAAKGVTPDKEIVVYCFKGARASNTYLALREAGFEKVSNYFASWNEWSRDDALEIDSKPL